MNLRSLAKFEARITLTLRLSGCVFDCKVEMSDPIAEALEVILELGAAQPPQLKYSCKS